MYHIPPNPYKGYSSLKSDFSKDTRQHKHGPTTEVLARGWGQSRVKKLGKIRALRTKERQKEGAGRHELVENQIPSPGVPLAPSLTVVTTAAAATTIKILNQKKKRN